MGRALELIESGFGEMQHMEEHMTKKSGLYLGVAAVAIALALGAAPTVSAQQTAPAVNIGATDIGGVVRGPKGPEAGVWVIAETTDLPTKMSKIVVTDDQGRYVIPDLPEGELHRVGARLRPRRFRQDARASPARS